MHEGKSLMVFDAIEGANPGKLKRHSTADIRSESGPRRVIVSITDITSALYQPDEQPC